MIIFFLPWKTKRPEEQSPAYEKVTKKPGANSSPPPAFNFFLINVSLSAKKAAGWSF